MLRSCTRRIWKSYGEVRRYATSSEIGSYFREHRDHLFWMALVITGSEELAESSIAAACKNPTHGQSVFLDWIGQWAQHAVVRSAIAAIKDDIASAAIAYQCQSCEHGEHEGLSETETRALRMIEPREIFTELDSLARSILILRALRNTTTYDCVAAMGVPRATVVAAYCRALTWLRARQIPEPALVANSAVK